MLLRRVRFGSVGRSFLARPRLHWSAAAAVLALACSVYQSPGASSDAPNGGSSGTGGSETAGVGTTSGTDSGATGGTQSPGAGKNAGDAPAKAGAGGTGGEPIEAGGGGEGGAPVEPDTCPNDPDKLAPGDCGCGVPEQPGASLADCHTLESLLV